MKKLSFIFIVAFFLTPLAQAQFVFHEAREPALPTPPIRVAPLPMSTPRGADETCDQFLSRMLPHILRWGDTRSRWQIEAAQLNHLSGHARDLALFVLLQEREELIATGRELAVVGSGLNYCRIYRGPNIPYSTLETLRLTMYNNDHGFALWLGPSPTFNLVPLPEATTGDTSDLHCARFSSSAERTGVRTRAREAEAALAGADERLAVLDQRLGVARSQSTLIQTTREHLIETSLSAPRGLEEAERLGRALELLRVRVAALEVERSTLRDSLIAVRDDAWRELDLMRACLSDSFTRASALSSTRPFGVPADPYLFPDAEPASTPTSTTGAVE